MRCGASLPFGVPRVTPPEGAIIAGVPIAGDVNPFIFLIDARHTSRFPILLFIGTKSISQTLTLLSQRDGVSRTPVKHVTKGPFWGGVMVHTNVLANGISL